MACLPKSATYRCTSSTAIEAREGGEEGEAKGEEDVDWLVLAVVAGPLRALHFRTKAPFDLRNTWKRLLPLSVKERQEKREERLLYEWLMVSETKERRQETVNT